MPDRAALITDFIAQSGWGDATIAPLAGDASNRRYLRLSRGTETAVLMDAPAEKGEDIRPFITIAQYLESIGLSAPHIYHADPETGLMLLEDLRDALFARIVAQDPEMEAPLYTYATQLLGHLHRHTPPTLNRYNTDVMTDMAALSFTWYLGALGSIPDSRQERFHDQIAQLLDQHAPEQTVLIQRDYHSENLLWLPHREGVARVGLLDFQDAMLGHPAYDLVSLLQDARRDVSPDIEKQMIQLYISENGADRAQFESAYHILGLQRNLRILGVFARLCIRDGKAHYVDLIPRVWALMQRDLAHPAAEPIRALITETLPPPTAAVLQKLKEQCAS